ncbi:MAG: 30S ribosomal protein S12 methylthiotransferase RimO [Planctomycetota bacterium]|jgi:ribosomal protein S12 methylthiotransferase|nr:30S ribosomal protein S12 methylthiotransferase RimO [Planctomycetota bacterium]
MAPKVSFISLGCPKNLVDSEVLLGNLVQSGFQLQSDYQGSDVVVVNTCGFLQASEDESMETIKRMVALKEQGDLKAVVVAGCLPQRHGPSFSDKLRNVDAVLGITDREKISDVCASLLQKAGTGKERINLVTKDLSKYEIDRDRLPLTLPHTAYLRLSEGCNHTCAFCIIPEIRGKFRSKPLDDLLQEARELAGRGVKELNLIAQDSTNWGLDLYRKLALDELLNQLSEVDGIEWLRVLYAYPTYVTERLIQTMAENPKVVKYVDMPIQHTRERMLRLMRRGMTESGQKELIHRWRKAIPDLIFRTTIIVGFPGETEEDFEGLMEDLRELRFERLGAFPFSREPGTRADSMEGHLPEEVIQERYNRLMEQQQSIAYATQESLIGKVIPVVVETKEENSWVGRTYGDAPDIDTLIYLHGTPPPETNIAQARIIGRQGYDLTGELISSS